MNKKYRYLIMPCTIFSFFLVLFFLTSQNEKLDAADDVQVETPPFLTYISGSGVVEPASGNIVITTPLNRVVEKINVSVNESVKKGDVLFELFNHDFKANLKMKQDKYQENLSNLHKLELFPREEDLIIAQENLNKAQAAYNIAKIEYCSKKRCTRSKEEKCINFYRYQQAISDLLAAKAEFKKIQCGTWQPDLKIAEAQVEQAKSDVDAMQQELERTYIKAPIDGTILQIKIHEGETPDLNKATVILGNIKELNLRVGIDQLNEARFNSSCRAVAFKQGDNSTEYPLKFIKIEPLMVPKKYLTNELHERVDTQIFEILYRIEKNDAHLYIGEQMDVYIYVAKENAKNEASTMSND